MKVLLDVRCRIGYKMELVWTILPLLVRYTALAPWLLVLHRQLSFVCYSMRPNGTKRASTVDEIASEAP
jgi:hypothetical protein